jgi:hypothetical protein
VQVVADMRPPLVREIERNLHDGAEQRFVSAILGLEVWRAAHGEIPEQARAELDDVISELRAGLAELRELAHGLHPAALSGRRLKRALSSLAGHAPVPVELRAELPERGWPCRSKPLRTSRSPRRSRTSRSTPARPGPGSTSISMADSSGSRSEATEPVAPIYGPGQG